VTVHEKYVFRRIKAFQSSCKGVAEGGGGEEASYSPIKCFLALLRINDEHVSNF